MFSIAMKRKSCYQDTLIVYITNNFKTSSFILAIYFHVICVKILGLYPLTSNTYLESNLLQNKKAILDCTDQEEY